MTKEEPPWQYPGRGLIRVIAAAILATAIVLAAVACGNAPSVQFRPSLPGGSGASTVLPAADSGGTAVATPSLTPDPRPPEGSVLVPRLGIAPVPGNLPDYVRQDWKHWVDADRDCQNTRAEVLIDESLIPVSFAAAPSGSRECRVAGGQWLDPFTGDTFTDAGGLDVDHLVPLANAHRSGGWTWNAGRKERFAKSLSDANHLVAVSASANRAKGDKGPEGWQPPDRGYHCQYAQDWIKVKDEWELTATAAEWVALEGMLAGCPFSVVFSDGSAPPDASIGAQPPLTGSPLANQSGSGYLIITEIMPNPTAVMDSEGEWFEVYNPALDREVDLNGWTIRDRGDDRHVIENGGPLSVLPGGYLVLGRNTDPGRNGGVTLGYGYTGFNLANSADEIELLDRSGSLVDRVAYGPDRVFAGSSAALSSDALDPVANELPANWCAAGSTLPGGDKGSPGRENDPC